MTSPNQMADPFVSTLDRRTQLLWFDLYERYSLAAQFVSALRGASPYAVLDVGGHSDVLWPGFGSLASAFIPDVKTFVIDLHREPGLKDYTVGSALSLPFSDRSFEFVLAADTLEHIPAADRQSFLHELLRVARGAVLLSFPFRTPLNEACERLVYRYIQMRKQVELPALREHLELGLPEIETVRQWVEETGLAFRIWNHGNTMLWLRMMLTKNHLWAQGAPEFGQELDAIFNVSFAAGDYREPCYRAFVAVSKEPGNDAVILNGIDGFRPGRLRAEDHDALFDLCGKIMESTSSLEVERRTQHSINIIEALGRSLEGQAERDKGHYEFLLEEQRQRAQDAENRLGEASSQLAHHKNLLEEQRQRAEAAENRLGEASSQLAHHKNLLEEQRQRAEDAENRLAEAASQAGHYKDLSEEQQRRAGDAENRLAEAASQAGHYKSLSEEQQRRAEGAENRLADASSQLANHKNLTEEQRQWAEDAENRLAAASSQLANHKNLTEEQRQWAEDAENRLAEASSQLAHHKNLTEEQRQRAEDAENRLAEAASQAGHYKNLSEEQQQRAEGAESRLQEVTSHPLRFALSTIGSRPRV
ncbi:MAG: methyltransferase domain-containing protein [Bryobacteraceae bacterium]